MSDYDDSEDAIPHPKIRNELPPTVKSHPVPTKPKPVLDPEPEPVEPKRKDTELEKERKRKEKEAEKARKKKEKEEEAEKERKRKEKETEKSSNHINVDLPAFFHQRGTNRQEENELLQDAQAWFLGTGQYTKSYSAFITYLGPRRVLSKDLFIARQRTSRKGNWQVSKAIVRFFRGAEAGQQIKDPKFVKDALQSANFHVRIVKDEKASKKKLKENEQRKADARTLRLPYRLRKDQIKGGLKIPLNPGEPQQIIDELEKEGFELSKDMLMYLQELKKNKQKSKEK